PTKEFQFFTGLKQGDPLSPFLFILIMESLHLSFQRVVNAGIFKGIKLSSSLSISHMFYADDFCGSMVRCKSKIMGVLVDSDKVKCVASKLECLILKTPFSYLGSKVRGSMSRVHIWNESPEGGVEQKQFDELSALVHDVTLTPMSDRWIWALKSSGDFFVASVRKVIDDKSLPEVDSKTR
nr:RNA-directed DNA polymerase, eukaryota [Tanacetum cinerariifolium]